MITATPISCKQCNAERYNKVMFIGGEFAYQCPECGAIHLFSENLFFDINDHFKEERWNRFSCIYRNREIKQVRDPKSAESFKRLLDGSSSTSSMQIQKIKISDREPDSQYFVASMLHDHFQEGFRAFYHLKGNRDIKGYRILIVPDSIYDEMLEPNKTKEIDEIWRIIGFKKEARWPYINTDEDVRFSNHLSVLLQKELDQLEGLGVCISKRAGAVPDGRSLLKTMLEPSFPKVLTTIQQEVILEKHVGILIHSDDEKRAGLVEQSDLIEIAKTVTNIGLKPLLIATTPFEEKIVKQTGLPAISVFTMSDQTQLYRDCISLIIGTNCSGCNIPALYDLPMFVFVKERSFPDDFYCFARMASQYQKDLQPWHAELEKADNIYEHKVPKSKGIPVKESLPILIEFLNKEIRQRNDYRIEDPEFECKQCGKHNKPVEKGFFNTDLYYRYKCSCSYQYLTRYGLTSRSFVESREVTEDDQKIFSTKKWKELERIVYSEKSDPIYIPLLKGSLADLYYMLPSILLLRRDFPKRSLRVITHRQFKDLIPAPYIDECYLLDMPSPYLLQRSEPLEERAINELVKDGVVVNNYPGVLPHCRNAYYHLNKFYHRRRITVRDVIIYCRTGNRAWPTGVEVEKLLELLGPEISKTVVLFREKQDFELSSWSNIPNLIINPDIEMQLELAFSSRLMVSAHGASQVIPCIANMKVIELETKDPWWKHPESQPQRFGIAKNRFRRMVVDSFDKVDLEKLSTIIKGLL